MAHAICILWQGKKIHVTCDFTCGKQRPPGGEKKIEGPSGTQSLLDDRCTVRDVDTVKEFTDILVPYAADTLD
jgi:hypothetical protein